MTDQNLKTMSVTDLLSRLENDIRYGCHSTRAEASRSFAGKELRERGREAAEAIVQRLLTLNEQEPENPVEAGVRNGLTLVLYWMVPDVRRPDKIDSGYHLARICARRTEDEFVRRRSAGEEGY
jgi:hypothetical protein